MSDQVIIEGYGGQPPNIDRPPNPLPFTGLDIAMLIVGGAGLLGLGMVIRRFTRGQL